MSEDLQAMVRTIKASGITTLGAIAKALQDRGIRTPAGAPTWHRAQVSRLLRSAATAEHHAAGNSSPTPPPPLVHVLITAPCVNLPVEPDHSVLPGWASAKRTTLVTRGRRLCVPPELAELMEYRREAVNLSRRP